MNKTEKILLNLCSVGDPLNPKTWSGTPFNIAKVMQERSALGVAFSWDRNSLLIRIIKLLESRYYRIPLRWEKRGRIIRSINGQMIIRKTNASKSKHTLHFGTGGMPFLINPRKQYHYVFRDTTWDLWYQTCTFKNLYSEAIVKLSEKLERLAYKQAKHIFCTAEHVKENLIVHYKVLPNKVTVAGTGPGVIKPFFGEKDYSRKSILFVAKERFKDKGGPILLEAFVKCLEKMPDIQLSIVGQERYSKVIKIPHVTCYGHVTIEILQQLFNSHTLFVMPALSEPWGLVYIEAMLCRMPIVGMLRHAFPELSDYGRVGKGIRTEDPQELCDVIVELFQDSVRLERMSIEAQEFALRRFTWNRTVDLILNEIHENQTRRLH
jgi:glycosyltransferase involved in cell wall biosynthesis